jgi:hypothetical protein
MVRPYQTVGQVHAWSARTLILRVTSRVPLGHADRVITVQRMRRMFLLLAVAQVFTVSCTAALPAPRAVGALKLVGDGAAQGAGRSAVAIGRPVTFSTFAICATHGAVKVSSVELVRAKNLKIVDWAAHRLPPVEMDAAHFGLARDVKGFSRRPVTESCASADYSAAFDVSVKTTMANGIAHGFRIQYSGGSLFVPMRLYVCRRACPEAFRMPPLP